MANDTSKNFASIRDDYAFFENHSTEAQSDLEGYARLLSAPPSGPVRLLDFGCGPGGFSAKFLTRQGRPPQDLHLTLVEPDDPYRETALLALSRFTSHPIEAWPFLPETRVREFDLALSNHALYYVPNLEPILTRIVELLAPRGAFVTAIAGLDNVLIQFWLQAFRLLDLPVPYNTSEDVSRILNGLGLPFEKLRVEYELAFPDGEENRMKILRFLLSQYLPRLPRNVVLDFFAPYAQGGKIVIRTSHNQYLVRQPQ